MPAYLHTEYDATFDIYFELQNFCHNNPKTFFRLVELSIQVTRWELVFCIVWPRLDFLTSLEKEAFAFYNLHSFVVCKNENFTTIR